MVVILFTLVIPFHKLLNPSVCETPHEALRIAGNMRTQDWRLACTCFAACDDIPDHDILNRKLRNVLPIKQPRTIPVEKVEDLIMLHMQHATYTRSADSGRRDPYL